MLAVALIVFTPNLYTVVLADVLFGLIVCILNSVALRKYIGYRQELLKTFLLPLAASAVMGLLAYGVNFLLFKLTGSNAISCILAICVAVPVYAVVLLLIKGVGEDEIRMLPKGASLVLLLKKMHLL